jgi:hypothetical protein
MENTVIQYRFTLADGSQEVYDLELDGQSLALVGKVPESLPSWTNLDFHECPHCPLPIDTHPHCPLAVRLVDIVEPFDRLLSYDSMHVEVVTEERSVSRDTTAEQGISSLMGLIIPASGCPHTAFFRPMARFHLPLANEPETTYRAASMYLMAQYFLKKEGHDADLELRGLRKIYDNIQIVNASIAKRLRGATEKDSSLNAIVMLDMFAKSISYAIEESLEQIRHLFLPFFTKDAGPV